MLLRDEDPKVVVDLFVILCTRRPGSTCVVVFDNDQRSRRLANMDYLFGPNGVMNSVFRTEGSGINCTWSETQKEARFNNGSRIRFRSVGHESDVAAFQGQEADALAFDRSSVIPYSVIARIIGSCHRSVTTVRDVIEMRGEPVPRLDRRRAR